MVFLVTGTSRGIGRAIAEHFLKNGNTVIGCSTGKTDLSHDNYRHYEIDLSDEKQVIGLFRSIRKEFKRLDVLINNAAINPAIMPAALIPYETMEKVFAVNLIAPMVLCREAVKLMSRGKFGRIINMGSMATRHEVPGEALYTSSKAGLIAYTRVLSKEVYKLGVTANVLAPSVIDTDLAKQINQEALQEVLNRNAVPDYGHVEDVTNSLDYLISKESGTITGQLIYLGGV